MYSRAAPPLLISSAHYLPISGQIAKAMIIHVAYPSGEQDSKGSPEAGNLGDLVILNRNTAKVSASGKKRTSVATRSTV
jgi:predicted amidohydrolase YtcJ